MRQRYRSGTTAGLLESTATGFCKRFPLYIAPDYAVKQAASKVAGHCQLAWIKNCMLLPASATAGSIALANRRSRQSRPQRCRVVLVGSPSEDHDVAVVGCVNAKELATRLRVRRQITGRYVEDAGGMGGLF
jgi:hypothetical protein